MLSGVALAVTAMGRGWKRPGIVLGVYVIGGVTRARRAFSVRFLPQLFDLRDKV